MVPKRNNPANPVTLPKQLLTDHGIKKDRKLRALRALERAGLVTIERAVGRAWRITLQDPRPIVQKPKGLPLDAQVVMYKE